MWSKARWDVVGVGSIFLEVVVGCVIGGGRGGCCGGGGVGCGLESGRVSFVVVIGGHSGEAFWPVGNDG